MGQAKQRGTFEERRQQAIIRDTEKRKELETLVGTTNDEKPFLPGEVIEFAGERYDVVENHGDSGLVGYFDDLSHGFFTFKWTYGGEKCRRVK